MPHDPRVVEAVKTGHFSWKFTNPKLRVFVEELEVALAERLQRITEACDETRAKMISDANGNIAMPAEELEAQLKVEGLPNVLRYAFFLIVFGVFEEHVAALCKRIHDTEKVEHVTLGRTYLGDSRDYLLASFDLTCLGDSWTIVYQAKTVRNILAHDAGCLRDSDNSQPARIAREFISKTDGISLDGNTVKIESQFIELMLDQMSGVFDWLDETISGQP